MYAVHSFLQNHQHKHKSAQTLHRVRCNVDSRVGRTCKVLIQLKHLLSELGLVSAIRVISLHRASTLHTSEGSADHYVHGASTHAP